MWLEFSGPGAGERWEREEQRCLGTDGEGSCRSHEEDIGFHAESHEKPSQGSE